MAALRGVLIARKITLHSEALLNACQDMMIEFGLSAEDLANELDAFSHERITDATLRTLRQQLAKKSAKRGGRGLPGGVAPTAWATTTPTKYDKSNIHTAPGYSGGSGGSSGFALSSSKIGTGGTPPSAVKRPFTPTGSSITPPVVAAKVVNHYATRETAGQVVDAFNKDLPEIAAAWARPAIAELGSSGFLLTSTATVLKDAAGLLQPPKVHSTKPLPVVFPCVERYGKFADVKAGGVDTMHSLALAARSVTFSSAYYNGAGGRSGTTTATSGAGSADMNALSQSSVSGTGLGAGTPSGGADDGGGLMEGVEPRLVAALASGIITAPAQPIPVGVVLEGDDDMAGGEGPLVSMVRAAGDLATTNMTEADRYMFTTPDMRAAALQARIDDLGSAMLAQYGIADQLVPVGTRSEDPIVCIGRICVASEAADGRINASSVLLEGIMNEGGRRVLLDLSEVAGYSLFPGQVVGVKGINALGTKLVVQAVYHGACAPLPLTRACNARAIADAGLKAGGGPLRVWCATGPFCCHADTMYQPLRDLLSEAVAAPTVPDVIVLMGPFVDGDHPAVKSGDILVQDGATLMPLTCQELLEARVIGTLEQALKLPQLSRTHLVLMPSYNDATCHPVHPHWPFTGDTMPFVDADVRERVVLVPNPATFMVGGLVFAATSTDVLFSMNRDEVTKLQPSLPGGGPKLDRLSRLALHCVEQRSMFPIYPAPASDTEPGVPLETMWLRNLALPVTPDILLLPSKLKTFARAFGPCLVINPGVLTKGNAGGTYAKIAVHPSSRHAGLPLADSALDGAYVAQDVPGRTKVDVVRI